MRPAGVSRAVDAVLRRPYEGAISRSFRAAMTIEADMQLAYLRDPRLAAHALSPTPAWLWREDAKQILWANPAGWVHFRSCVARRACGNALRIRSFRGGTGQTPVRNIAPCGGVAAGALARLRRPH